MIPDNDHSRIGISLPETLLDQFDRILSCRGYRSRSEGIRDAIRIYTISNQWISDTTTVRKGVITLVYRDNEGDGGNMLFSVGEIRNHYRDIIRASLIKSISHDRHLEIIIVEGTGGRFRELADLLALQKGIELAKISTLPV